MRPTPWFSYLFFMLILFAFFAQGLISIFGWGTCIQLARALKRCRDAKKFAGALAQAVEAV